MLLTFNDAVGALPLPKLLSLTGDQGRHEVEDC